jgi:hypothetical protein
VTSGKRRWMQVAIVLVVGAGAWWYSNPIRLSQKMQLEGVTVPVPFGWVVQNIPSQTQSVPAMGLRRAYVPWSRSWASVGISASGLEKPYTMESSRRAQVWTAAEYSDTTHYSNQRTFDVTSGKYPSLCAGGTMHVDGKTSGPQFLTCYIVGTPLMAIFRSSKDVDRDAERVLNSLN